MENQRKAYLYAAFVIVFWATVASAFKISLRYVSPLQLLLYASLTSMIVLFTILVAQGKLSLLKESTKREYLNSAILGGLNPFLYYIVLFEAYSLLQAQEAQPLNQTWIILLPLLSIIILRQKIGWKSIIALLIGFIWVFIIATGGDLLGFRFANLTGVLLALGSAVIWALFWIYNVKDKRDEVVKLFLNFLFGFIFILIVAIPTSNVIVTDMNGLLGAAYVGIFEMGLTFVLWLSALRLSKTTAHVSSLIYFVPFISLIIIHFSVGEAILASTIVGLLFIVAGVLVQHYQGRERDENPNPHIDTPNKAQKGDPS
jgi:drug/metabolite transporter (DMT)-like permease